MRKAVTLGLIGLSGFLISAPVSAGDLPAGHPPIDSKEVVATHKGELVEALPAGSYIYLRVKTTEGEEWLAATATVSFAVGAKLVWNDGMVMKNFNSKALNRTFASVRFVEMVKAAE